MKKRISIVLLLLMLSATAFAYAEIPPTETMTELIDRWVGEWAESIDVSRLDPLAAEEKMSMETAMRIALEHILTTHGFSFDELRRSSTQIIYDDSYDGWWVHVVPQNPVATFSILVDARTGELLSDFYGTPEG